LNKGRRAWVFAGGEFSAQCIPRTELRADDIYVCVDRGVEYCLAANLQPHILIGDLDSVSANVLSDSRLDDVPRQIHPSRKAASDLQITLEWLESDPPDEVILLGVSGGRTDHMLFNWLLPVLTDWSFSLQLIDTTTRAYLLTHSQPWEIDTSSGQTVSLLPLSTAIGVTTKGLQYGLSGATIQPGSTLGLSNIADAASFAVSLSSGRLLIMVHRYAE